MTIYLKAKCQIIQPTFRLMKVNFELDPRPEMLGEYVVMNLMRERGELIDGKRYQISICPLFRTP